MRREISALRAEFAATIFVRECLRQWNKMHPGQTPPMAALAEYPKREQDALIKAVRVAVEASEGLNEVYRIFIEDKIKNSSK